MIDTTKVTGRRTLRFKSLDALRADACACAAASHLDQLGNWTLGRALHHIAAWIDYPLLGYPPELNIPPAMKAQADAAKTRMMQTAMEPGERLPGIAGGTLATEEVPTAVGLAELEAAITRMRASDPESHTPFADPYFGEITRREWTEINLRHAELHLSFFIPR